MKKGEFLSVLGPSGCGKTTLLSILIGLEKQDGGTIEKDGMEITSLPPSERGMGIIFQNYALFPNMTVKSLRQRTAIRVPYRQSSLWIPCAACLRRRTIPNI